MKVGILTQYYRRNYGGILQSYALFRVLQNLGHEVEVIDFRYNAKANRTYWHLFRLFVNHVFNHGVRGKRSIVETRELPDDHITAFSIFKQKYMRYSSPLDNDTIGAAISKYDAIVVGSDQVWNDISAKHLFYFFDFGSQYKGIKIAYAPCSIITNVPHRSKKLEGLLRGMNAISVRDVSTQKLVETVSGITPEIVLDPTFLYDFSEFVSPVLVDGDYIFAYILGSEIKIGHTTVLKKIFEKYGRMKVVAAIIPDISLEVEKFADEVKYNASPNDWVNLIANAKFVYTDSFHGCVFSMKFHKPFFAYYQDSHRVSRLLDLKRSFGLDNIQSPQSDFSISDINYSRIDAQVSIKILSSLTFLKNNIVIE